MPVYYHRRIDSHKNGKISFVLTKCIKNINIYLYEILLRMYAVEETFVFKNQRFRGLCVTVMLIAMVVAVAYAVLGLINYNYCVNYPRFYCRLVLTMVFAIETALFAHRSSIYMEIGGDFALARRTGSFMILILVISALVEAYYASAAVVTAGTTRAVYMAAILIIASLATLPIVQFQYMDLHFATMRLLVVLGMAASLVSFCIGFFVIGLKEIQLYSSDGVFQTMSRVLDSLSPVYLINGLNGAVILTLSHITFKKEEKRNAKFITGNYRTDAFLDPEAAEPVVDEAKVSEEELEYNDL